MILCMARSGVTISMAGPGMTTSPNQSINSTAVTLSSVATGMTLFGGQIVRNRFTAAKATTLSQAAPGLTLLMVAMALTRWTINTEVRRDLELMSISHPALAPATGRTSRY